jgi:hypothetical protein
MLIIEDSILKVKGKTAIYSTVPLLKIVLALSWTYTSIPFITNCNINAFFTFDLFMVYIPECKQQLRTMK